MRATFVFVLGFATVFMVLGATASAMAGLLAEYRDVLAVIGGVVLILFGLHMADVLQIRILNYELRFQVQKRPVTLVECYAIGLAFGFGWTPCVGAVLAGILMLAAAEGSALHGALLLLAYAGGIGIPFLIAAALATRFLGFVRRMHGHMHRVRLALAGLLILSGILLLTGGFAEIAQWLIGLWPVLGRLG
jgi:cytochrome c-type biogenesis protein